MNISKVFCQPPMTELALVAAHLPPLSAIQKAHVPSFLLGQLHKTAQPARLAPAVFYRPGIHCGPGLPLIDDTELPRPRWGRIPPKDDRIPTPHDSPMRPPTKPELGNGDRTPLQIPAFDPHQQEIWERYNNPHKPEIPDEPGSRVTIDNDAYKV